MTASFHYLAIRQKLIAIQIKYQTEANLAIEAVIGYTLYSL